MLIAFPYIIVAVLVMQVGGYYLLHWMCCECAHQLMDRMPRDTWLDYRHVSGLVWFPERILDVVLNMMCEASLLEHRAAVKSVRCAVTPSRFPGYRVIFGHSVVM